MWFHEREARFVVFPGRLDWFISLRKLETLRKVDMPVKVGEGVDPATRSQSDSLDDTHRFAKYQMFDRLQF